MEGHEKEGRKEVKWGTDERPQDRAGKKLGKKGKVTRGDNKNHGLKREKFKAANWCPRTRKAEISGERREPAREREHFTPNGKPSIGGV